MGDLGEYWNDIKQAKRNEGWVSNQYRTDTARERGTAFKSSINDSHDRWIEKRLKRMGLEPVFKNTHSFQVTLAGRRGMYYCGRDEKIRFNDGQIIELDGYQTLEKLVRAAQPEVKEVGDE